MLSEKSIEVYLEQSDKTNMGKGTSRAKRTESEQGEKSQAGKCNKGKRDKPSLGACSGRGTSHTFHDSNLQSSPKRLALLLLPYYFVE